MNSNAQQTTFAAICREVRGFYLDLLGVKFSEINESIAQSLSLLEQVIEKDDCVLNSYSEIDLQEIIDRIFQTIILARAASPTNNFRIDDFSAFGRKKEVLNLLRNKDRQKIEDWLFAMNIQAYLRLNGYPKIRDLKFDSNFSGKNIKVCDFFIENKDKCELIECTRITPHQKTNLTVNELIKKIRSVAAEKIVQLDSTARNSINSNEIKHLYIDITPYSKLFCERQQIDKVTTSTFPDEFIEKVVAETGNIDGLDKITICIGKTYRTEDYGPITYTMTGYSNNSYGLVCFEGWSLETYPRGKNSLHFRELRLSAKTKSPEWIATSYNNLSDPSTFWVIKHVS